MSAVDVLFMKLGVRGASMLHASGDGGVSGSQYKSQCLSPGNRFVPTWPASSPFITSVGSTDTSYSSGSGFSGGGFSNVHPTPGWQLASVANYLNAPPSSELPPRSQFNASGRGIPDVSAVGENFMIVSSGNTMGVDGTSCSTPTFAGIVALINDSRVSAGKKGLGFLNQLFYSQAAASGGVFTDIFQGSNPGCGSKGFPALKGWDPITGLGSPRFQELLALAMSLP